MLRLVLLIILILAILGSVPMWGIPPAGAMGHPADSAWCC
jgi:hypothetical protein